MTSSAKRRTNTPALDHDDLAAWIDGATTPPWDDLLNDVLTTQRGKKHADAYHRAVERLLKALFYPDLVWPEREVGLHDGRKRVDLMFANEATSGFFSWVGRHHPALYVWVECKNYTADPANPELDQLSGRFSPSRGQVGLPLCRNLGDKELFIQRCRDTANDQRGFVLPLDDDDLRTLTELRRDGRKHAFWQFLRTRFDRLIL